MEKGGTQRRGKGSDGKFSPVTKRHVKSQQFRGRGETRSGSSRSGRCSFDGARSSHQGQEWPEVSIQDIC